MGRGGGPRVGVEGRARGEGPGEGSGTTSESVPGRGSLKGVPSADLELETDGHTRYPRRSPDLDAEKGPGPVPAGGEPPRPRLNESGLLISLALGQKLNSQGDLFVVFGQRHSPKALSSETHPPRTGRSLRGGLGSSKGLTPTPTPSVTVSGAWDVCTSRGVFLGRSYSS